MIFRLLITILVFSIIGGCATTMDARYYSQVDPDFPFTTEMVIGVFASEHENTLENKYYVSQVVEALRQSGFHYY